ncbi:DMT family transporter [Aeromonas veronii]|uniref:DMT family transporter n=1 Tax=Aeromonas veronii TaxID=654 RepID=UPI000F5FE22E|nr:DMT family transporter [Aeromonas veronii]MCX0423519.1 DMT family transporter [Aeromonas veronii]RRA90094.1 EamA family transporter [Aeromonas veronii bv. sobria]TNI75178.1 EamA family transporter [Aeromonas veronii]WIJ42669.1 DMT family transporter [Aeromonas veronii]
MNRTPLLLMVLVTLLAAAGWLFSKEAIRELPPAAFIGSRFLLAALLLLPLAWLREPPPTRAQLVRAAGCGTLLGASLLLWVTAISQSDALGSGAFIMSVATLMAPLAAWGAFRAKPGRHYWLTLPIAIAGLLLLSSSTHWGVSLSLFWFLAAATTLGIQLAVHRHFAQSIAPTWLTCIQLAMTGLLGTLLSLLTEQWPEAGVSHGIWGWFAASVLIATTLRYWLLTHALSKMTTAHAALMMLLEPVWTLILSTLFYSEPLGGAKLAGAGLVLGALVLYQLPLLLRSRTLKPAR